MTKIIPILIGLVLAAGAGGLAFASTAILPEPSQQVRIATQALGEVVSAHAVASVERIGGRRLEARCVPDGRRASLVVLSDGTKLIVTGIGNGRPVLRGPPGSTRQQLEVSAELAGCPRVLGQLLARRVVRAFLHGSGRMIDYHPRRFGIPAGYAIQLTERKPRIVLDVRTHTFEPFSIRILGSAPGAVAAIRELVPIAPERPQPRIIR
jgi:hypothetical protein